MKIDKGYRVTSKSEALKAIRDSLHSSTAPVDATLRQRLVWLFITDFMEVMKSHQGYDLESKHRSLQTTFNLFLQAKVDLICGIDEFDRLSRSAEFLPRTNTARMRIQDKIRKELYCFSSLAHSLQDHCRRLSHDWNGSYIKAAIAKHFGDDGLHDFICGLRSALHHRQMAEADWTIRNSGQLMTSHYDFDKSELLDIEGCWNTNAKRYLSSRAKKVDIRELCGSYSKCAESFYADLFAAFLADAPVPVADYRSIVNEHYARASQINWRFLITTVLNARVDPYKHLHKYLDDKDLTEAQSYPHRSAEQVDFIIGKIDVRDACTDDIRRDAYKLFKVAGYCVPDEKGRSDEATEIFIPLAGE